MEEKTAGVLMGGLIRSARMERGLTQKQLADRLGVTDKAVSKWERDGSCPDITLLIPLAQALGLEVTELLQGRRSPEQPPTAEEMVVQTLTYSSQAARQRRRNAGLWLFLLLSASLFLAAGICFICDFAPDRVLSWSWVTGLSLLFSWLLLAPPLLARTHRLRRGLEALTAALLPYLYLLGRLLREPRVFRIGLPAALISLIYLWAVYALCLRLRHRRWLGAAAALGLTALMSGGIDLVTIRLCGGSLFLPQYLGLLFAAAVCLAVDGFQKGRKQDI